MSEQEINQTIEAALSDARYGLKKRGLWYRPNACGYTDRESEAGRYTLEEAKRNEYQIGLADERVFIVQLSPRDYCNDMNAMHGAEETLDNLQRWSYLDRLSEVVKDDKVKTTKDRVYDLAHATARQRAEAWLRARGLWRGDLTKQETRQ